MKIKYSALVMGTSGKLNGSVAAHNKGGAYLRNKGVVSNPQTVDQQLVRGRFGALSSAFRGLTVEQIAAWNAAAADFPVIDRLGDTRYLTGLGLFVQLNTNLQTVGAAIITNPPAKQPMPAYSALGLTAEIVANVWEASDAVISFTESQPADAYALVVSMAPIHSPSVSNVKNRLRLLGSSAIQSGTTVTYEFGAAYNARFGAASNASVGQAVTAEYRIVSLVSGEMSAPVKVSTIITGG